jgi:hypothetical protein
MRACEGCRRRKIKCDSATTNIWPCAACVRLKLQCIHPNINEDSDSETSILGGSIDLQKSSSLNQASHGMPDYRQYIDQFDTVQSPPRHNYQAFNETSNFLQNNYVDPSGNLPVTPNYSSSQIHATGVLDSQYSGDPRTGSPADLNANHLSKAFGDLQIDVNGTCMYHFIAFLIRLLTLSAPYIADQARLATTNTVQDHDVELPHTGLSADMRIRIPEQMMPTDAQALEYFDYFFTHIHPFVPVLCQFDFYQSWHRDRDSISPLILEAVFACVTAMLGQTMESNKWIALAKSEMALFLIDPANKFRTRRLLSRFTSSWYTTSVDTVTQSSRVPSQTWLLL